MLSAVRCGTGVNTHRKSRLQQFDVHANQIKQWKDQLLEGATGVFGDEAKAESAAPTVDVKTLHAKIGELTLENDFLSSALGKAGLLSGKK
ncbi:transposase (plasmid) [Rhizobium favelukesii]|uniref:Transposase n=1 Tax=Rhizobium favelukesii TaxID=348824 RepID=W6RLR1_9HYPH|nr:transposase [Rhizobium favelukesii]